MAAAASLQPAAPPHHDLHHRHDRPRLWTLFLLHPAMAWTTSSMLMQLRWWQLDLLLLLTPSPSSSSRSATTLAFLPPASGVDVDNIRPVEAASVAAAASLRPAAPSHDLHIITIGHDSGLSSSSACRCGFGGGSGVTPTCCSSLHDLHHRHDRPRLWPFFLLHPAMAWTTSGLSIRLRWRHSDLLLLHMIFINVMIGHDSGHFSACIRR